jgi:threonine/homoserine/homoserine lactone efflux protein
MRALVGLFGILWFVAMIIKLIWWILGAVLLYAVFQVVRHQLRLADARREAEARHAAQVATRAEQQHRWVLQGDDRGVYGEYPVAEVFSKPAWSQLR